MARPSVHDMIEAWKKAAEDLNLEIKTPFYLNAGMGRKKYALLIKRFGSAKGTLVMELDDSFETGDADLPRKCGYYCSFLNPLCYRIYDRENFVEVLTDWGFFGLPDERPGWLAVSKQ
jgi:hypothetical protein